MYLDHLQMSVFDVMGDPVGLCANVSRLLEQDEAAQFMDVLVAFHEKYVHYGISNLPFAPCCVIVNQNESQTCSYEKFYSF